MLIYIARFYSDLCENCNLTMKYFRPPNIRTNSFEALTWRFLTPILAIANSLYTYLCINIPCLNDSITHNVILPHRCQLTQQRTGLNRIGVKLLVTHCALD